MHPVLLLQRENPDFYHTLKEKLNKIRVGLHRLQMYSESSVAYSSNTLVFACIM